MLANLTFKNGGSLITNIPERYDYNLLVQMMMEPTGKIIICEDDICGYHRVNIINLYEVKLIQIEENK